MASGTSTRNWSNETVEQCALRMRAQYDDALTQALEVVEANPDSDLAVFYSAVARLLSTDDQTPVEE